MKEVDLSKGLKKDFDKMEIEEMKHKAELINTLYTSLSDEIPSADKLEIVYWEFYDEWIDTI